MNNSTWARGWFAACGLLLFATLSANAQTTTTIVNDSFADGISNAGPGQIGLFTTSSSSGLDPNQAGGPVDFATGGSGRAIHGTFAPQTLSAQGDRLDVFFDFTTPLTIAGNNNEVFRFGLFDTAGAAGFNQNISSSTGTPNPILNALAGFSGELDDINAQTNANVGTSDLIFRTHDINGSPSGRLLTTTSGFDNIGSGTDDQFLLLPNTDYLTRLSIELNAAGDFDLGLEFFDAAGSLIGIHTDTALATDGAEVGINTNTFDFFGISASGGAFGSNSGTGDADNGIDINNITIQFTTSAVPEPSSICLIALTGLLGLSRRRR